MFWLIDIPKPVPFAEDLVVKKDSKIRSCTSGRSPLVDSSSRVPHPNQHFISYCYTLDSENPLLILLHCITSVVAEVDEDLLQLDVIAHYKGKAMPKIELQFADNLSELWLY